MKYLNLKPIKNLIITLLTASLLLCGCGETESTSSDPSSEISSDVSKEENELTPEIALELLNRDKEITEMFVCNSLCDKASKSVSPMPLSDENEYASFSAVRALLESTYSAKGGNIEYFLSYAPVNIPSVSEKDGKTYVFNHSGNGYSDYMDFASAKIHKGKKKNERLIKGKSISGRELEIKVVYENDKWLLEKGIFMLNPENSVAANSFSCSNLGSLKKLSGRILVVEFFVFDKETDMPSEKETEFHNKIQNVFQGMADQASKLNTSLMFDYQPAYFKHDYIVGNKSIDFDIVFAETGFGTLKNFAESQYDLSRYDGYVFVVCMNKDVESSYNRNDSASTTEFYYGERMFIGNNTTEAEMAAFLLNIAGMEMFDGNDYCDSLYRVYFPNDYASGNSSAEKEMSVVTAYACGMVPELKAFYSPFIK